MDPFFSNSNYFVKEHVGVVSSFDVMDSRGHVLGSIEENGSLLYFLMSLLVPKSFRPIELTLADAHGRMLLVIKRSFAFLFSKFTISDPSGRPLAILDQRFSLLRPHIDILSPQGTLLGSIHGDFAAWDFTFYDANDEDICSVNKKWNGFLREAFTTADQYQVSVSPRLVDPSLRMAVVAAAAVIDIIYKEK